MLFDTSLHYWTLLDATWHYLILTMFDILWHFLTPSDAIWFSLTLLDAIRRCLTLFDTIWRCLTLLDIFDAIWHSLTLFDAYDAIWHYLTPFDVIWHFSAVFGTIRCYLINLDSKLLDWQIGHKRAQIPHCVLSWTTWGMPHEKWPNSFLHGHIIFLKLPCHLHVKRNITFSVELPHCPG